MADHNSVKEDALAKLKDLVDSSEIITTSSPEYLSTTLTWSKEKDKQPSFVVQPKTTESLSKVVAYLSTADLEFKVRSQGYGNASAKDVLVSLSAFNDFEFNEKEQYVILGAGQTWRGYYDKMQETAPDWHVVACRTPCIGIGGSTLCGGFSWQSAEYGCVSDAANMLDAEVVLLDGTVKWASTDPELLWALRGTESGFAIVTRFKFRARKSDPGSIWAGPVLLPRHKVQEVAQGIMLMVEKDYRGEMSPKVAMFLYVARKEILQFIGANEDMLVVHAYDARGEKHGREEFEWAFKIEGAIDQTKNGYTHRDVALLQEHIEGLKGTADTFWSPIAFSIDRMPLTQDVIIKSFEWWNMIAQEEGSVAENGYLLFELFFCRENLTGRHSSAWPRPKGYKHLMLLGTGCKADAPRRDLERARRMILKGSEHIVGKVMSEVDIVPNGIEDFHSVPRIYGEHYDKLRVVKRRLDPQDRLKGWIKP